MILLIKNRCSKADTTGKIAQSDIENAQIQSLTRVPEVYVIKKWKSKRHGY